MGRTLSSHEPKLIPSHLSAWCHSSGGKKLQLIQQHQLQHLESPSCNMNSVATDPAGHVGATILGSSRAVPGNSHLAIWLPQCYLAATVPEGMTPEAGHSIRCHLLTGIPRSTLLWPSLDSAAMSASKATRTPLGKRAQYSSRISPVSIYQ